MWNLGSLKHLGIFLFHELNHFVDTAVGDVASDPGDAHEHFSRLRIPCGAHQPSRGLVEETEIRLSNGCELEHFLRRPSQRSETDIHEMNAARKPPQRYVT